MFAAAVTPTVMVTRCSTCGTRGRFTRELGDIEPRAKAWYAAHRTPYIISVLISDQRGRSLGWWRVRN